MFALDLSAPLGETASASLSVANTRDEVSVVRCRLTEVRRSDGVGPSFVPAGTVTPQERELAPQEDTTVTVSLLLDDDRYVAGPLYIGSLHVSGHGDVALEVPLRITATSGQPTRGSAG
jgi:hypothetical protein